MTEQQYQSKIVQKLNELYLEWDKELNSTGSFWGLAYKMFRAEIPHLLKSIDEDRELQGKIRNFVLDFAEAIREEGDAHTED